MVGEATSIQDAVIWLDDLERFASENGRYLSSLVAQVCVNDRRDVVVVATIRDAFERVLERSSIDHHKILIGRHLDRSEEVFVDDHPALEWRLAAARRAEAGFGEFLVAGVEMMQRWSASGDPRVEMRKAVITAAVDCRRAGCDEALPESLLGHIYPVYLPAALAQRSDLPTLGEALADAAELIFDASSCLVPKKGGLVAADDLLDRTQDGQGLVSLYPMKYGPSCSRCSTAGGSARSLLLLCERIDPRMRKRHGGAPSTAGTTMQCSTSDGFSGIPIGLFGATGG